MTTFFSSATDHEISTRADSERATLIPAELVGEDREPLQVATTRTIVNASAVGTYRSTHQATRLGADDHLKHRSRGIGA